MYNIKYRPTTFDEFIGNDEVVNAMFEMLNSKKISQAIMLSGSSGIGKTTLSRIFAKEVGATGDYIIEMNVANTRGIDTIRNVIENSKNVPLWGSSKVYIFDESHGITSEGQNALLKIIEDAPRKVYFIFCTTNPTKMIETIRSRCVRFELKPLDLKQSTKLIDRIAKEEKLKVGPRVRELILKHSMGIPRSVVVNLFRIKGLEYKDAKALIENTVEGVKDEVVNICRMFTHPETLKWIDLMVKVENLVKEDDAESIRRMMFSYFSAILKKAKTNKEVVYWTNILEMLDFQIETTSQGIYGLVYLLGRIVSNLARS